MVVCFFCLILIRGSFGVCLAVVLLHLSLCLAGDDDTREVARTFLAGRRFRDRCAASENWCGWDTTL